MIPISENLREAIKKAAEDVGNPYQLSIRSGVSNATVMNWLNGKTSKIYEETMDRLLPMVLPHLGPDDLRSYVSLMEYTVNDCKMTLARVDESCDNVDNLQKKLEDAESLLKKLNFYLETNIHTAPPPAPESEAIPVREANVQFRPVPVLSIAQAAGYEPALEPLCDYLRENGDRTALFFDVPDNCFALEVSGNSMAPDYPNGSIALVAAGEFPQRGDLVAAKLSTGQVVIKQYNRKDNVITLSSINPDGKNFEWHCKDEPGFVLWMWPVIEITLKPRDQRWTQRIGR